MPLTEDKNVIQTVAPKRSDQTLYERMRKRHVRNSFDFRHLEHPKVELLRSAVVEVEAAVRLPVETDGEVVGTTPARFEILPGALRVRLPA